MFLFFGKILFCGAKIVIILLLAKFFSYFFDFYPKTRFARARKSAFCKAAAPCAHTGRTNGAPTDVNALLRKLFFFYVCFFVVFIFIGGYFGLFL